VNVCGFHESNMTVLMDDGNHPPPTRNNILAAYQQITIEAQPGDAVFCHYSGHGGKLVDDDGDEEDGYDETLVPLDYESAGQIRDDDLFQCLVGKFERGVTVTCIMDCCHSGTVLDLPYVFKADGESDEMRPAQGFDYSALAGFAAAAAAAYAATTDDPTDDILAQILGQCGCTVL